MILFECKLIFNYNKHLCNKVIQDYVHEMDISTNKSHSKWNTVSVNHGVNGYTSIQAQAPEIRVPVNSDPKQFGPSRFGPP